MRNVAIVVLTIAVILISYFWGKNNGANQVKATLVNQIELVKEIAELASLEASGVTQIKLTNAGDDATYWNKIKNFFVENTLLVQVPFKAKYGIKIDSGDVVIKQEKNKLIIHFPEVVLLSFQIELDKVETMNQTGLFASTTIADFNKAQQQMYQSALKNLNTSDNLKDKAKNKIVTLLSKYFAVLGYSVECTFGK